MENQPAVKFAAGLACKRTSNEYCYLLWLARQAAWVPDPARSPTAVQEAIEPRFGNAQGLLERIHDAS
jgi:hypothetical protein